MSLLPQNSPDERSAVIVRTSLVGIGVNVLLAAMKELSPWNGNLVRPVP